MKQPLGKHPSEIRHAPFGALAFVQSWCPHCQEFHPEYERVQQVFDKLQQDDGVRFPRGFQIEAVEATPPSIIGQGVPELVLIFNHQIVPLKSRFWTNGKQLALALYALYVPFFQRWKENERRYLKGKAPLSYDDVVTEALHPNDREYSDYNDFVASLPDFLEKLAD